MTYLEEQDVLYSADELFAYCEELDGALAENERLCTEQSYKQYLQGLLEGRGEF